MEIKKRRNVTRGGGKTKFSQVRMAKKVRQEDLATLAGVTITSIKRYEREGIGCAKVETAAKIAAILMCRIEDLMD
ncbi:MAG: helix-turn-helix transcriptional regulator [Lachnospiraceae bacterium]|nr:helix-turn-helix transcriptional regulator [Lachnospiraceae bacterium]